MYLLDTNICIDLMAGKQYIVNQLKSLDKIRIYLSAITIGELVYGAMRSARPAFELDKIRKLIYHFLIIPIDTKTAQEYGILKSKLASKGMLLEDNDLFIAANALAKDLTLVTRDKAFSRIDNLKLEDWNSTTEY